MIYHHKESCIFKTAKQFWSWTWYTTSQTFLDFKQRVTGCNEHAALLFQPSEDSFNTNLYQLFLFYQIFTFLRKWNYNPFAQKPAFKMSTKPLQNSMAFWIVMLRTCITVRHVITFRSNRLPPSL